MFTDAALMKGVKERAKTTILKPRSRFLRLALLNGGIYDSLGRFGVCIYIYIRHVLSDEYERVQENELRKVSILVLYHRKLF